MYSILNRCINITTLPCLMPSDALAIRKHKDLRPILKHVHIPEAFVQLL